MNANKCNKLKYLVLSLSIFLASCTSTIETDLEFYELSHSAGLGHFYYIGSDDDYHHFATDSFLSFTRYYKYQKRQYNIDNTFPKTKDKSKWIPYLFDGKDKKEGFNVE